MVQPATRLITLIMLLQRHPNQKAADLARELGVSVRSLHRYVEGLDEMGIPVYTERGPYGGFSLVRGYKLPPLVFTAEEAVVISLGASLVEELWGTLYPQAAASALAKLDALLPEAQRQEAAWARRSLLTLGLQRPEMKSLNPLLEQIRQAVHDNRQLEMTYQSPNRGEPASRTVDPFALVYRWGWWYLAGFCHSRKAMRLFRLDRIERMLVLEIGFQARTEMDLRKFVEQTLNLENGLTVHLKFSPEMASVARANRFNWQEMEDQPDGSILVTMKAPDLPWAASLVLAYGPGVTVLEPESVRQEVGRWAQAILENYKESNTKSTQEHKGFQGKNRKGEE